MGPSLHSRDEATVKIMDWTWRISAKEGENSSVCWQGNGVSFLGHPWNHFYWFSPKRQNHQQRVLCELIAAFERWNQLKTAAFVEKESIAASKQCTCSHVLIAAAKINELKLQLLAHTSYSPYLAPSDYFLFLNLKKWFASQKFSNNKEAESAVMAILRYSTILPIKWVS